MSDQWGPTGAGDDAGDAAQPPPPPPPPPPGQLPGQPPGQTPVEPTLTLDSEHEVTRSGGAGGRVVAGLVGALLLVGGTVFAVSQLGSSGAGSPEEAVSDLLDAASNEDVLGLMAALDPGERDALRDPVEDLFDELKRLEVLDSSFALDGVDGFDFSFDDVTYRTEPVANRDDLTRVYFTGGTVTASINSDEIPIGDFVADTLERFDQDISGFQETETSDITDGSDTFLVARNGSDGWRVSLGYTAAEAARIDAALAAPGNPIAPIGADSPEAAVEGLFQATADLDMAGIIARLSPGEMRALQDYAGLFLGDAEAALAYFADDVDLAINDLSLRSEGSGDRASVFIDAFDVSVEIEETAVRVAYRDECFTIEGDLEDLELADSPFADGPVCTDELDEVMTDFYGQVNGTPLDLDIPTFPTVESVDVGITTTKVDGDWYVAPIATSLDAVVAGLESLERSHLDSMVDFVEEMAASFESAFTYEESFSEVGEALPEDFYEYDPDLDSYDPDFDEYEYEGETGMPNLGGSTGFVDEKALREFVFEVAQDQQHGECILGDLELEDEYVRFELADAHAYDYDPTPQTLQVFQDIYERCAGR